MKDHFPSLPDTQCLKNLCFIYFSFLFLVCVSSKKGSLGPCYFVLAGSGSSLPYSLSPLFIIILTSLISLVGSLKIILVLFVICQNVSEGGICPLPPARDKSACE